MYTGPFGDAKKRKLPRDTAQKGSPIVKQQAYKGLESQKRALRGMWYNRALDSFTLFYD